MPTPPRPSSLLPRIAVALPAAWILAGALFKLFAGSPNDLPPVVRDLSPLDVVTTYRAVIAIELGVVVLALLRPAEAWLVVVLQYLVFGLVLAHQIRKGQTSCGCFGSSSPLSPRDMAWIDGTLIAVLVAARPWRLPLPRSGASFLVVAPLLLVAVVGPWLVERQVKAPPEPLVARNGAEPAPAPPARLGRKFAVLDPEEWIGKTVAETPLADWLEEDVATLPTEGTWILWRWTCDHCAEHLEELAANPPAVPFLTLVRVKEPHDADDNRQVFFMPEGEGWVVHANLTDAVEYVIETPADMDLEEGVIRRAREGIE